MSVGENLYRVSDLEVSLAAGTSAEATINWADVGRVRGLWLADSTGTPALSAALELGIYYRRGGKHFVTTTEQPSAVPGFALLGSLWEWCDADEPVAPNDKWTLRVTNAGLVAATPRLRLHLAYR